MPSHSCYTFEPWDGTFSDDWERFCDAVANHIETYTIPQYGDYPSDQMSGFSIEDIRKQIDRYENRRGKRLRGIEEEKRDCLKIAHYVQVANDKTNDIEGPRVKSWWRFVRDMNSAGVDDMSFLKAYMRWMGLEKEDR